MIDDKQKLLFLMWLLQEETDPAHPMNAAQISEKMEIQYECSYDRKTSFRTHSMRENGTTTCPE